MDEPPRLYGGVEVDHPHHPARYIGDKDQIALGGVHAAYPVDFLFHRHNEFVRFERQELAARRDGTAK